MGEVKKLHNYIQSKSVAYTLIDDDERLLLWDEKLKMYYMKYHILSYRISIEIKENIELFRIFYAGLSKEYADILKYKLYTKYFVGDGIDIAKSIPNKYYVEFYFKDVNLVIDFLEKEFYGERNVC